MTRLSPNTILEWLRRRSPATDLHRHRSEIDGATVYLCRTADASDTMRLRVNLGGSWALHTTRCVVWDDGTHRAIGDRQIESDRYCSDAIEALTCYYDTSEMQGIP